MDKKDFFTKNDELFLGAGFEKNEIDPMFYYERPLIDKGIIEFNEIPEDEIPKLLYGTTGINQGFCIYTGAHFIWINAKTASEACEFAAQIVSFEEN